MKQKTSPAIGGCFSDLFLLSVGIVLFHSEEKPDKCASVERDQRVQIISLAVQRGIGHEEYKHKEQTSNKTL